MYEECEALQRRFTEDLHARDMQWEQMFEQMRKDSHELMTQREKELLAKNGKMERDLEEQREKEQELLAEVQKMSMNMKKMEHESMQEMDHLAMTKKHLEHEVDALKRERVTEKRGQQNMKKQLEEALEIKAALLHQTQ